MRPPQPFLLFHRNELIYTYIHLRILRKPMSTKHNEVCTQGSVSTFSWCLQYLGTFQNPQLSTSHVFGMALSQTTKQLSILLWLPHVTSRYQHETMKQVRNIQRDGTCQDIDWPGYVSWIFECEIRFLNALGSLRGSGSDCAGERLDASSIGAKSCQPSGKHTKNYGKSPFLMGKSTINHHFQ